MAFGGGTTRQRHGDGRSGGCTAATGRGHGAAAWHGSEQHGAMVAAHGVRESSGRPQPWVSQDTASDDVRRRDHQKLVAFQRHTQTQHTREQGNSVLVQFLVIFLL
ncbi:hypothetical protein GUJ93_ZPchr0007g4206 [Zizania palustris]|uniref:Uncharacterized protein n=1 Tax=Zizania palustris TaxID=103762 RepID=A0A8J5TKF1_ZIZPA|nr:hypothetical protein GUJ93_ZPchr0007g4206 [Zizania palustris]